MGEGAVLAAGGADGRVGDEVQGEVDGMAGVGGDFVGGGELGGAREELAREGDVAVLGGGGGGEGEGEFHLHFDFWADGGLVLLEVDGEEGAADGGRAHGLLLVWELGS